MLAPELFRVLADAGNLDGGWGYQRSTPSRIEPTAWALLATMDGGVQGDITTKVQTTFFGRCQGGESLLAEHPGQPANIAFNNLAALAVLNTPGLLTPAQAERLFAALVAVHGLGLQSTPEFDQDNGLRGWPWTEGAFSWVEPTSWGVIVMKKLRRLWNDPHAAPAGTPPLRLLRDRIDEAEKMLVDRCTRTGGWNYGNRNVLGQDLRPYVSTTAVALMALQDRADDPAVARSLSYLREHAAAEPTGMALSLSTICLRLFGQDTNEIEARLATAFERSRYLGLVHVTAMAAYALSWPHHEGHALRV
jgi:hypothetical protein